MYLSCPTGVDPANIRKVVYCKRAYCSCSLDGEMLCPVLSCSVSCHVLFCCRCCMTCTGRRLSLCAAEVISWALLNLRFGVGDLCVMVLGAGTLPGRPVPSRPAV